MAENNTLLEVKDLHTYFYLEQGISKALHGVSFDIKKGETLGVVGESGCGKSMTALSIMQLVPNPPGRIVSGEISFKGEDLLSKSKKEMRDMRGSKIAMIFQEPMTSLNPVMTIGKQIEETIRIHEQLPKAEARKKAIEMLKLVRIPEAEQRYREYPHQLSGGMRQRVMIAIALACQPDLLICDEPTTALDVTVQAQILKLIAQLQKKNGMSVMLITHDLGVISQVADRIVIMYAGKIVEYGTRKSIFQNPLHPYTEALLKAVPKLNDEEGKQLYMIKGMVPDLSKEQKGCLFAERCPYAQKICFEQEPDLQELETGKVCCHRYSGKDGSGEGSEEPGEQRDNKSGLSKKEPGEQKGDESGLSKKEPGEQKGDESGLSKKEPGEQKGDESGLSKKEPGEQKGDESGLSKKETEKQTGGKGCASKEPGRCTE